MRRSRERELLENGYRCLQRPRRDVKSCLLEDSAGDNVGGEDTPGSAGMFSDCTIQSYHSIGVPFGLSGLGMPTSTKFMEACILSTHISR